MIRITICDDNTHELSLIEQRVNLVMSQFHQPYMVFSFSSSVNLLYEIRDNRISDIYLVDVSMPEVNGFQLAEEIRTHIPDAIIIFITSHSEQASIGYRYKALRYVDKNRLEEDLYEAMECAVKELERQIEKNITVYRYNDVWKIPYSNIVFVSRTARQLEINTTTQGIIIDNRGIQELYDLLNDDRFLFIDRSCFVNIDYASQISGYTLKVSTGHVLPISRRSLRNVKSTIVKYWGN